MTDTRKIGVLHVLGALERGGAETWLLNVVKHTDRSSFAVDFLVHSPNLGAYEDEVKSLGCRVFRCVNYRRPRQYASEFKAILASHGPFDVVHSHVHFYSGSILRAARQAGVSLRIAHSHIDTSIADQSAGIFRRTYLTLMRHWIDRHANVGLAASEQAAHALFGSKWNLDSRRRILFCGIDLKPFYSSIDPATVRRELKIPEDAFVIGHVGRFDQQKNHEFLIDIFAQVVRIRPEARLLLIGQGETRSMVEQKVAQAGLADHVVFAGTRSDVPRLMLGAMDVFVFPSRFEGLPLVLVEAQAAGLPCVISDVIAEETTVVPSLIRRLSLAQSPNQWAKEIEYVCADSTTRSSATARSLVESSPLNIKISTQNLESLYRDSLTANGHTMPFDKLPSNVPA